MIAFFLIAIFLAILFPAAIRALVLGVVGLVLFLAMLAPLFAPPT